MSIVTVYFNATSRFMAYQPDDTMVPSRVFRDFDPHVNIPMGATLSDVAEATFILGNMDSRPNPNERSISVGDVILVHSPDGGVPMAVENVCFRQLSLEEWGLAQFVDWHPMVMR